MENNKKSIPGMKTCKVCGRDFPLTEESRYTARDNEVSGVSAAFSGNEENLYDAMDCLHCGCQNILQPRKRALFEDDGDYCVGVEVEEEENE